MNTLELDITKRYTFADYLTWADDVRRELFDGFIKLMTPAPVRRHQKLSRQLFVYFANFLDKKNGKCEVYHAPFDVRFPKKTKKNNKDVYTVVQPDIVVVCDPEKLDDYGCIGAPDLIVEIVSPTSVTRDVKDKFALYEAEGVREYWIVYPGEDTISIFVLENGKYQLKGMYTKEDKVKPSIFDDLEIDLENVFKD
jgi:Uma2 family endonuclease